MASYSKIGCYVRRFSAEWVRRMVTTPTDYSSSFNYSRNSVCTTRVCSFSSRDDGGTTSLCGYCHSSVDPSLLRFGSWTIESWTPSPRTIVPSRCNSYDYRSMENREQKRNPNISPIKGSGVVRGGWTKRVPTFRKENDLRIEGTESPLQKELPLF